ncbi:MAG: cyclase family protein [Solobacterium sp.]|nr:cyclase family protein [Solobacterium sp.]MBR3128812.1 cyclase family protein [Solobacterium sp.]
MLIDLTLEVTPEMIRSVQGQEPKAFMGHLGTHFDVMDKEFPLAYTVRPGIVFDVRGREEIGLSDVDLSRVKADMFMLFHTGHIAIGYGTEQYRHNHPQLSMDLIEALIRRQVSIIGIDAPGVRRGREHTPADQYCADHDMFIVENMCHLEQLPQDRPFLVRTFPVRFAGQSGLPCRVIAETE